MLTMITLCATLKIDPQTVMKDALEKYRNRYSMIEQGAKDQNKRVTDLTIEEKRHYWNEAKKREKSKV